MPSLLEPPSPAPIPPIQVITAELPVLNSCFLLVLCVLHATVHIRQCCSLNLSHSLLPPVSTRPFFESAQTLIIINDS